MTTMTITSAATVRGDLEPAGQRAGADSGDPQLGTLSVAPEAAGNKGVWECQPGGWPVVDRQDTEVCYILSGRAILTDVARGDKREITAGDLVVLPVGWTGRWDVIETVRKVYAIY